MSDLDLTIPAHELTSRDSMRLGFRMEMFEVSGESDERIGNVCTGGGCGSDAIIMTYNDRICHIRARDLYQTWVQTFDPEGAARLPVKPYARSR